MRAALSRYLLDVYLLLRDEQRQRGFRPGPALERDLEVLAQERWLHTERRVHRGPFGGAYYSGLGPETDLFVYDGPQFLHVEAKDLTGTLARAVPTEFWARALDLHLGRARDTLLESPRDHYVVLVISSNSNDRLRAACLRWGICLIEPSRLPFVAIEAMGPSTADHLRQAGCSEQDLQCACLPFNRRFPHEADGVLLPLGRLRSRSVVDALLRFQWIAGRALETSLLDRLLTA
jgi:hypothetical protein